MIARENPFRTERVLELRYRLPEEGATALLDRFEAMGRRGALVGPQGSGKTTLLEDLVPAIEERGYRVRWVQIDDEPEFFDAAHYRPFFTSLDQKTVVLLDSAEKMGRRRWRIFDHESRRTGGLLVTSHNPGLLQTLLECRTTPALLEDLVRELVGPEAGQLPLEHLYERHRGNLRDVLRALYDLYAERT
jgi:energy-coupling factor transporter ATP-binding protein EcfA2